jgi:hypothetical protein
MRMCVFIYFQYPERVYPTSSGVMSVAFSQAHPNLLAVSCFSSASIAVTCLFYRCYFHLCVHFLTRSDMSVVLISILPAV